MRTAALTRSLLGFALSLAAAPAFALSVSLTAPSAGAVVAPGTAVTVSASATRTNNNLPITKVEFFAGTTLIGTDTNSPYSISWANVQPGTYSLTAKATDSSGATATSAARSIRVNNLPSVSITAPANGANFAPGSTINLAATASDTDGTVSQVQFFRGTTLIGTDTTSPYTFAWTGVAAGTYALTAKATDNNSGVTTSTVVNITVDVPPTVSISSPANNAVFLPGATVTINATAADTGGSVSKVEFFDGATLIGTDTTTPYSIVWSNGSVGTHTITARATDNQGVATTSAAITVRIDAPPGVSITAPANNAVFVTPANVTVTASASDTDGIVAKVEFFEGAALLGTVTVAPYSVSLTNVPLGTHSYTARATDNNGAVTNSAAVSIIVNAAPTASITSPAANAIFAAPANITVNATAADSDGTVTKVDFFDGATLTGTATTAPYSVTITNASGGSHSLTARATDNRGTVTTSASVTVIVDAPPTVTITSPANNAVIPAPANITITASAADTDGTVAQVDFFDGATPVGTATVAPYSITLTNVALGAHSYTARATDNLGTVTTSNAINVIVNAPPTVAISSPAANTVFTVPANNITVTATAADGDGSVTKVDFFDGATLIGTATAAPYTATITNAAEGSHVLTAQATDDRGTVTTSTAVSVTVNAPPVSITSPANGASFTPPANVTVTASTSGPEGSVMKVDFYQDGTLVGTATTAPYSATLSGLTSGSYVLTAIATDGAGATTTSAAVTIRVNAAPTVALTSPATGASFTAPASITIAGTATDSDGTIGSVSFYFGTTLISTRPTAPYTFTWTGVPQGSYVLTAVATDELGATTTSPPVTVTVTAAVAQGYYIDTDHLNTPRLVADAAGTTVWRWDQQEPFGVNLPDENPSAIGGFEFPLRFAGQYLDKETNLHYNYFRDCYDPSSGRFCQSDPIGLGGGINTYGYVFGRPLTLIDPQGLGPELVLIPAIVIVGGMAISSSSTISKPKNLSPSLQSLWDRFCANSDNPCAAILLEIQNTIEKMRNLRAMMLADPRSLFSQATTVPNPAVTGTVTTWATHILNYERHRTKLAELIALAATIPCPVPPDAFIEVNIPAPSSPNPR